MPLDGSENLTGDWDAGAFDIEAEELDADLGLLIAGDRLRPVRPPLVSNRWYGIGLGGVSDYRESTNWNFVANQMLMFPVYLTIDDTFDAFGTDIATGQAGAGLHICIYNMATDGEPGTRAFKSAEIDVSGTGLRQDTASTFTPLKDGWYWMSSANETASVAADWVHVNTAGRINGNFGWDNMTGGANNAQLTFSMTYATEPCPADLSATAPTYAQTHTPHFGMQKQ